MKIIIIGAGRIGRNLSKSLAEENNEVYLIERNEAIIQKVSDKLDVKIIVGEGADPDVLRKANIQNADLVLAVTTSDETNLVVCSLAAALGAKRRIARVRNTALSQMLESLDYSTFHIDEAINPELVAAETIAKTIASPGASEVVDYADGKILLRAFDISEESPLCGQTIGEFRDEDFPWPFLIVAIARNENVLIPKGDAVIQPKDHVYVLLPAPSLPEFISLVDPAIKMPKKIVIYGASITGRSLAVNLIGTIRDIILIEEDVDVATEVAGQLEKVRVIHGSATEADILTECGIEAADVFVGASKNDQSNLISSVLAKKMGVTTTIITTQQQDFLSIANTLNIDAVINPHHLAVKQILHLVRGRGVSSVTKLFEGEAEAIEFLPEAGSPVTKDALKNIKFPKNSIVGAVYRGDDVHLADGETYIHEGDKVVVFCQKVSLKKLQQMFTRR